MKTLATRIAAVAFLSRVALGVNPSMEGPSCYDARGVVREIQQEQRSVVIMHEAIAGYMPAMTMRFRVEDHGDTPHIQPGDAVTFRLNVTKDDAWIDFIRITDDPRTFLPAMEKSEREAPIGKQMPDVAFVDQSGEASSLGKLRGRVVVLSFIYTRCPLPTYCPLINHHFEKAQALVRRLGLSDRCEFVSLSLDPTHDSPEILARYAAGFIGTDRAWHFASAPEESVRELGNEVGLIYKREGKRIDHNLRTIVLDVTGRLRRVFRGNEWTPQELAAEIRLILGPRSADGPATTFDRDAISAR